MELARKLTLEEVEPLRDKFDASYSPEPNSGCFLWETGSLSKGYGYMCLGKKVLAAHRVSFLLTYGWLPDTLHHICNNRICVNPNHLRPISRGDNVLLGTAPTAVNKRKTQCIHGHPFNKENTGPAAKKEPWKRRCRACHRKRENDRRKK